MASDNTEEQMSTPDVKKRSQRSILVINPNTTKAMTDALKPLIESLNFHETEFSYFTASSGVQSINNSDDATISTEACLPYLIQHLASHNGFIVCCYSRHPLVGRLREEFINASLPGKIVTGIFEASVAACLQSINATSKFGIISTGKQWEVILTEAVTDHLGSSSSSRYVGTETTGLNANELHRTSKEEVNRRMKGATKRLLEKGVQAICLGCAGMAGMDRAVRQACIEFLGEEAAERVVIVDGVVSATIFVEGMLRARS